MLLLSFIEASGFCGSGLAGGGGGGQPQPAGGDFGFRGQEPIGGAIRQSAQAEGFEWESPGSIVI